MKIAVVSDDGVTVNQHFGRAPYYVVATVDDGKLVSKETRVKVGHHTFAAAHRNEDDHVDAEGRHGYSAAAACRHTVMVEPILDCDVLICGGMGWGAYESMKSKNIDVFVTDNLNIDEVIKLYLAGTLPNLMDRLH